MMRFIRTLRSFYITKRRKTRAAASYRQPAIMLAALLFMASTILSACQKNKLNSIEEKLGKDQGTIEQQKVKRRDLNLAIAALPRHQRPEFAQTLTEKALIDQLYEGPVTFHNNRIRLQQAEKITSNAAKTVWTIKLRPDLRWSDGSRITAEDYRQSWLRYLTEPEAEAYRAWIILNAEAFTQGKVTAEKVGIKAQDDTLTLTLQRPLPNLPAWLTQSFFCPSKFTADGKALYNGAYQLSSVSEKDIKLQANRFYWDEVNVWLKDINIKVIPDEIQAYEAYHTGIIDFIGEPFYAIAKDRRAAAVSSAEHLTFPLARLGYIKLENLKHPLFAAAEKRQALYTLLDAPFQSRVILQDGSAAWPQRLTPDQAMRQQATETLKKGLSAADLESLTDNSTVGVGGQTILENRLLVSVSKDWLNALRIRFHLLRVAPPDKPVDFRYCTEQAPTDSPDSLLQLWSLRHMLQLDKKTEQAVWPTGELSDAEEAELQQLWQKLPTELALLPLTTRFALIMTLPNLVGVNVDKTGRMLLSDLQWR